MASQQHDRTSLTFWEVDPAFWRPSARPCSPLFRVWWLQATEIQQSLSHWLWYTNLSVGKRERTNTDEDKMTVKAVEQRFRFSYIYTAKGNWLHSRQKHWLSAETLCLIAKWSPVLRNGDCSSFISSWETNVLDKWQASLGFTRRFSSRSGSELQSGNFSFGHCVIGMFWC